MTLQYIQIPNPQPNILYYRLANGQIRTRPNNTNYVKKKPQGVIKGTNLTLPDLFQIQQLLQDGAQIQTILSRIQSILLLFPQSS